MGQKMSEGMMYDDEEVYGDAVIWGREDLVSAIHGEAKETANDTPIDPQAFDDL